jgi:hypothetical protein
MPPDLTVMAPYVQWGFAGFCFVVFATLTTINVWLMKNYIAVVRENNKVISGNTAAITTISETAACTKHLMSDIRDQLLQRPCLMDSMRKQELARQAAMALEHVADRAAGALDHVAQEAAETLRAKAREEQK